MLDQDLPSDADGWHVHRAALIRFDDEFAVRIPIALNHQAHDAVFE
jgi:hypothetical protein